MNSFDIIALICLAWGFITGLRKGLIVEVSRLLALILGLLGAFFFSKKAAFYLADYVDTNPQLLNAIGFLLLFIVIVVAISMLARAVTKVLKLAALGLLNRILGGVFGGLKWALIVSALVLVYEQVNTLITVFPTNLQEGSLFYGPLLSFGQFCFQWLLEEFTVPESSTLL